MRRPLTAAGRAHLKRRMMAVPKVMREHVETVLESVADELVLEIQAASPVDKGELRDSIQKEPIPEGEGRTGWKVTGGWKGGKGFYIRFVEFGTKPSPASQGQLFKRQKGKWRGRRRRDKPAHAGVPAQPFFWPTYRRMKSRIRGRITRALRKGAEKA